MQSFLISTTVKGIKGLSKPVTIRFVKNKSVKNVFDTTDRVRAIYGPNGCGKSSFIYGNYLALRFLIYKDFIPTMGDYYLNQLLNRKDPIFTYSCDFAVAAEEDDTKYYRYGFEINGVDPSNQYVSYERFQRIHYKENRLETIFETTEGNIVTIKLSHYDSTTIIQKSLNVVRTQSLLPILLRMAKEQNFSFQKEEDLKALLWFAASTSVALQYTDLHPNLLSSDSPYISLEGVPTISNNVENSEAIEMRGGYVMVPKSGFDTFEKAIKSKSEFIKLFKQNLKGIVIDKKDYGEKYACRLIMDYGDFSIEQSFESSGIKRLINLYDAVARIAEGYTVFIDEIDTGISGVYLSKLIDYVNQYTKGQLCFTAHTLDPMFVLADKSKSIYFMDGDGKTTPWTKNSHYMPYKLYPEGMIGNITFNIEPEDFISIFN